MTPPKGKKKKVEFPDEGVVFTLPPGYEDSTIFIAPEPIDWPEPLKFKPEGFVINFAIFPVPEKPGEPIELEVKYQKKHLDSAGDRLVLGIFSNSSWKEKTEREEYLIEDRGKDRKWIGAHKIHLKNWETDPMVAWGP